MDTYLIIKYLHLLAVAAAFSGATVLHLSLIRASKAERVGQALDSMGVAAKLAPVMPLVALALLLTGAYLTQNRWSWGMPWIHVSATLLLTLPMVGVGIMKPRMKKIGMALGKAGDGPMTDDLRKPLRDPVLYIASHYPPIMAAAIMYLMVTRPGRTGSWIAMGVAVVLVVASAVPKMRK
jgi:uncharacterized membrane protein